LAEMLLEAGYDLSVHDPDLDSARLVGVNFALGVEHQEVLVERMVEDVEPAAAKAAVMILGKPMKHLPRALLEDPRLIDIDRLGTSLASA